MKPKCATGWVVFRLPHKGMLKMGGDTRRAECGAIWLVCPMCFLMHNPQPILMHVLGASSFHLLRSEFNGTYPKCSPLDLTSWRPPLPLSSVTLLLPSHIPFPALHHTLFEHHPPPQTLTPQLRYVLKLGWCLFVAWVENREGSVSETSLLYKAGV